MSPRSSMLRLTITAAMVVVFLHGDAPAQAADVRALVVGVDSGPGQRSLHGARELARRFGAMGFTVELLEDPDKVALERGMDRLAAVDYGTRLVIFAYGGHGLEFRGVNYLIPSGTVITAPADIDGRLVPLSRLLNALEPRQEVVKLFILDACRSIPSDRWLALAGPIPQGLADPTAAMPTNSFVAFAAPPGAVAADGNLGLYSPFTRAVLASLPARGLPVQKIFARARDQVLRDTDGTQVPWEASSLVRDVELVPAVRLEGRFTACDDVAFLFHNGAVKRACPDSAQDVPIELVPGRNEVSVGIYNQKTYVGGRPPLNLGIPELDAHFGQAEGWKYELGLTRDGVPFRTMAAAEDRPAAGGSRHGRFFVVSRLVLDLDADSGTVSVVSDEPDLWKSQ